MIVGNFQNIDCDSNFWWQPNQNMKCQNIWTQEGIKTDENTALILTLGGLDELYYIKRKI